MCLHAVLQGLATVLEEEFGERGKAKGVVIG